MNLKLNKYNLEFDKEKLLETNQMNKQTALDNNELEIF